MQATSSFAANRGEDEAPSRAFKGCFLLLRWAANELRHQWETQQNKHCNLCTCIAHKLLGLHRKVAWCSGIEAAKHWCHGTEAAWCLGTEAAKHGVMSQRQHSMVSCHRGTKIWCKAQRQHSMVSWHRGIAWCLGRGSIAWCQAQRHSMVSWQRQHSMVSWHRA